jgi:hypothetical protein
MTPLRAGKTLSAGSGVADPGYSAPEIKFPLAYLGFLG